MAAADSSRTVNRVCYNDAGRGSSEDMRKTECYSANPVREIRLLLGLPTEADLAGKLGITTQQVSNWEKDPTLGYAARNHLDLYLLKKSAGADPRIRSPK